MIILFQMETHLIRLTPVLLILFALSSFVLADPPVTPEDKAALKKFRPDVEHFLPHDWMKEDGYLLRWIRTKKYDLEGAKELLMKNIEWRKENNIDKLKYDPKSVFARDFPIYLPGVDNDGRPVVIGDWSGDFREVVAAGQREELSTHLATNMEIVERKMRDLNVRKNNSQWLGIYDFNNFAMSTHLCTKCLPLYLDHALIEESYYPLGAKEYILINTPSIFQTVLQLVAPILMDTLDRVTTFGTNKDEWKQYILERVPVDQIPAKYGGTQ